MAFEKKIWTNNGVATEEVPVPPAFSADNMNRIEQGIADAHTQIEENKTYTDDTFARIKAGSYIGTGTYGSASPNTLTFDFSPQYIRIEYGHDQLIMHRGHSTAIRLWTNGSASNDVTVIWDEKSVTWYSNRASNQFNSNTVAYWYHAIG